MYVCECQNKDVIVVFSLRRTQPNQTGKTTVRAKCCIIKTYSDNQQTEVYIYNNYNYCSEKEFIVLNFIGRECVVLRDFNRCE